METIATKKANDYTETHRQQRSNLTDDELRDIGWKMCSSCQEMRPGILYYKSKRRSNLAYSCKLCHRKKVSSYKGIEGSYAWYYRRFDTIRRRARKKGLEFSLTVEDVREIKDSELCAYCGLTNESLTFDRVDNNIGYTRENIRAVCYLCNKLKSNLPFNEKEMKVIGKGVAMFYERTKNNEAQKYEYGEDIDAIKDIVKG